MKVDGHRVIVTGASKGIGKSICLELAKQGWNIGGIARSEHNLSELEEEIRGNGVSFLPLKANVQSKTDVRRVFKQIESKWGAIDALINNAGGAIGIGDFFTVTEEDWFNTFELNVMGIVRCVQSALPMLKKSLYPSILNILSTVAKHPGWKYPHYAAAKSAALNLSKHLSIRLSKYKIRVNSISPGPVHSSAWDAIVQTEADLCKREFEEVYEEIEQRESAKIPLGRIGEGKDIAGLSCWLISQKSSWITGSNFVIDGGKTPCI